MKALIGSELLGHSDEAVKVSVVLCLSEIMRITAPRQPYDDAVMKVSQWDFLYFFFCYPLCLLFLFIYLIFNSILAFYKHFQFRLEFLLLFQEIFQHIVGTFEKLSNVKSHCYSKAAQILDNVSKVRACVMLLDLECDTMVVDIIKLFLRIIRYQPSMCSFLL